MSPDTTTNDLRHRGPPSGRDLRIPQRLLSSPSSSPKKPKPSRQSPKPKKVMSKCYSEPLIFQGVGDGDNGVDDCRSFDSGESGWLTRFHTLDDVLSGTSDAIDSPLYRINAGYEKDAKVLITVTVEGSPGPIRTLIKLGTSVEDTIKLVVQKYGEEGRTPRLDKDSVSFDLHVSYFSLQCLERSDAIGDAGSRTFYLRKNDKKCREGTLAEVAATTLSNSAMQYDDGNRSMLSPTKQLGPPMGGFPPFIAQRMNKFERRLLRLLMVLGCLDSK
ncbi:uncharacterized protein At4g22758-like [Chenopodium quinoa]|uniref:DUF7054 domain-containing protein n=1 Tax=Chenopodium quinoa TaxID=63459 RepID=A0A803LR05_CHEQI|nr:uncharacterized protein At4g22758-like [Chenopodium quinoa]